MLVHSQCTRKHVLEYTNPITAGIDTNGLRDCQVFRDGEWWYMTGTSYPHWVAQEITGNLNKGVALYRSKDLTNWNFVKYIIERPASGKWYYRRFWAPEIHKIGNKYYTLFNCNNDSLGFKGQNGGYAVADQIEGPYTIISEDKPLTKGNDLTFFQDDDGSVWAFWNNGPIVFAKIDVVSGKFLTEPKIAILKGSTADYEYDKNGVVVTEPWYYDGRQIPKVTKLVSWDAIGIEGSYVIKNSGTYYLFYSSWTRGYEVGYATASKIDGPWTKHPSNPFYGAQSKAVCARNGLVWNGDEKSPFQQVGHNAIFKGPDGRLWISCHGSVNRGKPFLVMDPIWFDKDGNVKSNGPTYTKQTINLSTQNK